mgnify:CR=1 FL=1
MTWPRVSGTGDPTKLTYAKQLAADIAAAERVDVSRLGLRA